MRAVPLPDLLGVLAPLLAVPRSGSARRPLAAMSPRSDGDLVDRARGGDDRAAEEIFRRHADLVSGIAARVLRSRVDAEDVVQETFIAVLGHLDALRDGDALRGYLAQTAVRACRRRLRRRKILSFLSLDTAEEDWGLEAMAADGVAPEVRAELGLLDAALASLPFEVRVAWTLRRVEDLPLDEVANACGCSLATVKRRVSSGDAHVRAHVRFDLQEEP